MDGYRLLCNVLGKCPDLFDLILVLYAIGTVWGILIGITAMVLFQRRRAKKQVDPEAE